MVSMELLYLWVSPPSFVLCSLDVQIITLASGCDLLTFNYLKLLECPFQHILLEIEDDSIIKIEMIWPGVRAIFSEDPHCPNALLISKTNVYFVCTCYLIVFIYEIKPKHANLLYCCSVAPPQFSSFEKKVIQRRTKESKGTEKK